MFSRSECVRSRTKWIAKLEQKKLRISRYKWVIFCPKFTLGREKNNLGRKMECLQVALSTVYGGDFIFFWFLWPDSGDIHSFLSTEKISKASLKEQLI